MTLTLEDLLFEGSPFQPVRTDKVRQEINGYINIVHAAPAVALAIAVGLAGVDIYELHQRNRPHLSVQFGGVDKLDLSLFLFGFNTPPLLIQGGYLMNKHTPRTVIKILSPGTQDETRLRLNQYRLSLLFDAHRLCVAFSQRAPAELCPPIWDLCVHNPFSDNIFFRAGVESSRRTYLGYAGDILIFRVKQG